MPRLNLSLAVCNYDHLRDLADGTVRAAGIDINPMIFDEPHHIFHRMARFGDFDIAEMSFGGYVSLLSRGANTMIAIPVFPSRVARCSAFYVPAGARIAGPEALGGLRIGVPQWAQTAGIYARGWLADEAGVDLRSCDWYQSGVDEPARLELASLEPPPGFRLTQVTDRSLSGMLLDRALDCVISALPPKPFREGSRKVKRLISGFRRREEAYFRKTGVFPIMHLITIRRDIVEKHPWVAANLVDGFEAAKNNALARALRVSHSLYPIPWGHHDALRAQAMFGEDFWPYGLAPNRPTIEAFLGFCLDQGIAARPVTPEELFAPQTLNPART